MSGSIRNRDTMFKFASHQMYGKFMMDINEYLGIFYEAGTGKTALALWWIRDALKDGRIDDALIICPASLIPSWVQAIDKMAEFETFSEEDVQLLKERVKLTSYQRTYRTECNGRSKKIRIRDDVDKEWGAIIVDEAHGIGAHNSVQTKAAIALSAGARYRYILTATPTHGGGGGADFSKLYGQFQFLTQGKLWKNWTAFCSAYVKRYNNWHKPVEYDNEACSKLMQEMSIVCRLKDCFDMPGLVEETIPCPLAAKQVYKDLKEGNIEPYGIDITVSGGQYLKMLQVCSGSMKREDMDTLQFPSSKDDVLRDLLNGTEDKVIIFCNFRASIDRCAEICRKANRKVQIFDGRSKTDTWKDLEAGRCDTLICQYQSGGVGLNLQSAHIMILFEPCLSSLLMEQAKGRIYRKGQDERCLYYFLVTQNTIEVRVLKTVLDGIDVNAAMIKGWLESDDWQSQENY